MLMKVIGVEMQIYVWNISSYFELREEDPEWQQALELIEQERREKIQKFRNHKDKARSLAAGLLLRYGYLQYVAFKGNSRNDLYEQINAQQIDKEIKCAGKDSLMMPYGDGVILSCQEGEHEKPYLVDYPEVHFNLSHSGDYVALVIGESECGIDVQEPRNLSERFCLKFFHEEELSWLEEHSGTEMNMFSLKEAFMKYSGRGMSRGMKSFSVVPLLEGESMVEEGVNIRGEYSERIAPYSLGIVVDEKIENNLFENAVWLEGIMQL